MLNGITALHGVGTPPTPAAATQFLISGGNSTGGSLRKTWLYNISSDTYTSKTDRTSDAGEFPGAGYDSGNVYVFGGGYSNNYVDNYAYSVSGNSWSSKTSMTEGRIYNSYVQYDNKFWTVGGGAAGSNNTRNEFYYYSPSSNTWTSRATLPATRAGMVSGVIGTKIYVSGGFTNVGAGNSAQKTTYEYDPVANTWTTKADSQYFHARNCMGGTSDGTNLFAFGSAENSSNNSGEKYSASSNSWSNATNPTNTLQDAYAAAVYNTDGKIYVATNSAQAATQVYDIAGNSWTGKSGTVSPRTAYNSIALVP